MQFYSVDGEFVNTIVIERSKFICSIKHVENEEEAKEYILNVKKANSLATHNCYAYIADDKGLVQKFSDDGEPQGTAGLPMLEVLKIKKIYKTVAVVTRYFGGIKLGTGGLTRAYSSSVSECLNIAKINLFKPSLVYNVLLDYNKYSTFLSLVNDNVKILDTIFDNVVSIKFALSEDYNEIFTNKINDTFCGEVNLKIISKGFNPF